MDGVRDMTSGVPAIVLVSAGLLILGLLWGLLRGLAPLFGSLLWVLLALGLGTTLAPVVLAQMPNTPLDHEGAAALDAFGVLAGVVLLLPVLARLLGSGAGKRKPPKDRAAAQRVFGAVTGLAVATLITTLVMPFALRLPTLADNDRQARAPTLAEGLAESLGLLYPAEVGASLRGELDTLFEAEDA